MRDKSSLITASEVAEYVYCALAWRLRADGHEPTGTRAAQEAGIKWHDEHGRDVERACRFRAAATLFAATALFLALLLLLYLVLR
jgi:hypothetical protein